MIFLTKKDFEEAVDKRASEIRFKRATEEELWDLKNELIELKARVNALENAAKNPPEPDKTFEPAPYWTNPNWVSPAPTCSEEGS